MARKCTKKTRAGNARGGRNVPKASRYFSKRENAVAAGSKGGKVAPSHLRTFAMRPDHASRCGKKGGAVWRKGPDGIRRPPKNPPFPPWEY